MKESFEKKILVFLVISHIVAGFILPLGLLIKPLQVQLLTMIYSPERLVNINPDQTVFWISVLGPTIASWGILFYALVKQYFDSPSLFLWRFMLIGGVLWAPYDSLLCFNNGIYMGVVINVIVMIFFLSVIYKVRHLADV